jgi:predicted ArsR family transcriptional regulator
VLTAEAEKYFPHQYDRALNAVLREVREVGGDPAVRDIFAGMSRRGAERLRSRVGEKPAFERVAGLTAMLREFGVEAEFEQTAAGFTIREHNCPYSKTVGEHPEVCNIVHSIMQDVIGPRVVQTESLATGGMECRFEIAADTDKMSAECA